MASPVQLSERVYYLPGGVNTAVVRVADGGAVLVDTGQDKDYGRKLRKACEELGVKPVAIINTHAHADHYGGNDYLLRQFDVPVYALPTEASLMQSPYLEPVYLFGGAKPPKELLSKWLLAKPSRVDHILEEGSLELSGATFDILDTSGHAHRQISLVVDGVLLAADALFGASVLQTYPLPFGQDVERQITSAEKLKSVDIETVLPGHGDPSADLLDMVEANLAAFTRAAETVLRHASGSADDILVKVCAELGVTMTDLPRYFLNRCVLNAYLSYLRDKGKLEPVLDNNRLIWKKLEVENKKVRKGLAVPSAS